MPSGRVLAIVAVAAAFAAGLGLGLFLGTGRDPGSDQPSPNFSSGAERAMILPGSAVSADREKSDKESVAPSGSDREKISARFWATLTNPDDAQRQAEWIGLLANLRADNAMEVRELFRKMDRQGRWFIPEWDAFWPRWGEVDPSGALAHIPTIPEFLQPSLAEKVLRGWGGKDAAGARSWLTANMSSPLYGEALRGYLDGLARTNLEAATRDAALLGKDQNAVRLTEVLTDQALRQRQLGGMVDWWRTLPDDPADGSLRKEAVQHVYYRLRTADHDQAAEFLGELAKTPYFPETQIRDLSGKMSDSDPLRALNWLATLPPSPSSGRHVGFTGVVSNLARKDPVALEGWIQQQPPSALRDRVVVTLANHLKQNNQVEAAQRWLGEVKDLSALEVNPRPGGSIAAPQ